MKIKELRELEESKLQKALEDAKKELIQLGKSSKKRVVRRQIARILTIMNERKKGIEYKKEEKKKEEKKEEKHKEKEEKKKEVVKEKEEKAKKKIEKPKKKSLKTEKRRK